MQVQALSRAVRLAPAKARPTARLLRGLPVDRALATVAGGRTKAAALIRKTLQSAVANVAHNAKLAAEDFRVAAVLIERGPAQKRFWARSRGMARPVQRRSSHIRVILTNESAHGARRA